MANIFFNKQSIPESPTLLLKRRDLTTIGAVTASEIVYKNQFFAPNELSFRVYRYADEKQNASWQALDDYNVIYIPEYGEYFDAHVSLNEENGTYKTVTCTALAESELSQTKLYDIEINTDADMARPDYDEDYPTVFYREVSEQYADYPKDSAEYREYKKKKESSLLHRILEKASNYSIGDVDDNLKDLNTWYQFSISDSSILDVLTGEIAEQYQCLFTFEIQPDGTRLVHAHDLCNTCSCGYRGDFHDKCPKCGGTDFRGAYGRDTTIFVSKDNLATSAMIESNKDSLKNCFRIIGGDDLMTAAVKMSNPNGSNTIYYFSEETMASMPEDLADTIRSYNNTFHDYLYTKTFLIPDNIVKNYNQTVDEIKNLYPQKKFSTIESAVTRYQLIPSTAYNAIDLALFLESEMMKTPDVNGESIDDTLKLLTPENIGPIAVSKTAMSIIESANRAVLSMCKTLINTALYKAEIAESQLSNGNWIGKFRLTSLEDKTVIKLSGDVELTLTNDEVSFYKQKIQKTLSKESCDIRPILDVDISNADFQNELRFYSKNYLDGIRKAFQECRGIVQTSGLATLKNNYENIYNERISLIEKEIEVRESQLRTVNALYHTKLDTTTYEYTTGGYLAENIMEPAANALNFQKFLEEHSTADRSLWNLFCAYRREDTYQNQHYISNGLSNSQLMENASKLVEAAQKELYKAGTMQYNVNASMNNLLALKEFEPIAEDFTCGNWIRLGVEDKIYYLRLLSYQIHFDDFLQIDVEFSTVEKIWSGISDVESILSSASSVSGSYSATISQVRHSAASSKYVDDWVQKGLDATKTQIVDNAENQKIIIDQTGILCCQFDDITETRDPNQIRIIGNGLYTTHDNWKTMDTGIGTFIYNDPENGFTETKGYGIIADTVVGSLILGENLGIYNSKGSLQFNEDGLVITNDVNQIMINPNDSKLLKIDHNGEDCFYADENGNLVLKGTVYATDGDFKGSIHIGNGSFTVDSNGNIISNGTMSLGAGKLVYDSTGLKVNGVLTALSGSKIGGWMVTDTALYNGSLNGNNSGSAGFSTSDFTRVINGISRSNLRFAIGSNFGVTDTGVLYCGNAEITGTIHATGGTFSNTITCTGTISGGTISGSTISGGKIEIGSNFTVDEDGNMTVTNASISGKVTASSFVYKDDDYTVTISDGISIVNKSENVQTSYSISSHDCSCVIRSDGIDFYNGKNFTGGYGSFWYDTTGFNFDKDVFINEDNNHAANIYFHANDDTKQCRIYRGSKKSNTHIGIYDDLNKRNVCIYDGNSFIFNSAVTVSGGSSTSSISDQRLKYDIENIDEKYELLFHNLLPKTYKYQKGTSGRNHIGFIAQDVEVALDDSSISTKDFAGLIKQAKSKKDEYYNGYDTEYALRYEEFIALNTHMIQKLYKENETLKQRITNLERAMA